MTNFFPRLSQNCGVQEGLKNAFDLHSATRHNFVNATNTLHHWGKYEEYLCISYTSIKVHLKRDLRCGRYYFMIVHFLEHD